MLLRSPSRRAGISFQKPRPRAGGARAASFVYLATGIVWGALNLYWAFRFREYRKFLAGAFFVSWGVQVYFYFMKVSVPLVGTSLVVTPEVDSTAPSSIPSCFLLCPYFGFSRSQVLPGSYDINGIRGADNIVERVVDARIGRTVVGSCREGGGANETGRGDFWTEGDSRPIATLCNAFRDVYRDCHSCWPRGKRSAGSVISEYRMRRWLATSAALFNGSADGGASMVSGQGGRNAATESGSRRRQ